jgi:hypothetical protein
MLRMLVNFIVFVGTVFLEDITVLKFQVIIINFFNLRYHHFSSLAEVCLILESKKELLFVNSEEDEE